MPSIVDHGSTTSSVSAVTSATAFSVLPTIRPSVMRAWKSHRATPSPEAVAAIRKQFSERPSILSTPAHPIVASGLDVVHVSIVDANTVNVGGNRGPRVIRQGRLKIEPEEDSLSFSTSSDVDAAILSDVEITPVLVRTGLPILSVSGPALAIATDEPDLSVLWPMIEEEDYKPPQLSVCVLFSCEDDMLRFIDMVRPFAKFRQAARPSCVPEGAPWSYCSVTIRAHGPEAALLVYVHNGWFYAFSDPAENSVASLEHCICLRGTLLAVTEESSQFSIALLRNRQTLLVLTFRGRVHAGAFHDALDSALDQEAPSLSVGGTTYSTVFQHGGGEVMDLPETGSISVAEDETASILGRRLSVCSSECGPPVPAFRMTGEWVRRRVVLDRGVLIVSDPACAFPGEVALDLLRLKLEGNRVAPRVLGDRSVVLESVEAQASSPKESAPGDERFVYGGTLTAHRMSLRPAMTTADSRILLWLRCPTAQQRDDLFKAVQSAVLGLWRREFVGVLQIIHKGRWITAQARIDPETASFVYGPGLTSTAGTMDVERLPLGGATVTVLDEYKDKMNVLHVQLRTGVRGRPHGFHVALDDDADGALVRAWANEITIVSRSHLSLLVDASEADEDAVSEVASLAETVGPFRQRLRSRTTVGTASFAGGQFVPCRVLLLSSSVSGATLCVLVKREDGTQTLTIDVCPTTTMTVTPSDRMIAFQSQGSLSVTTLRFPPPCNFSMWETTLRILAADAPMSREGWLFKMGGGRGGRRNWKRRWFVLDGGTLTYYKKPKGKQRGHMCLAGATVVASDDIDTASDNVSAPPRAFPVLFAVQGRRRTLYLSAQSVSRRRPWMESIQRAAGCRLVADATLYV